MGNFHLILHPLMMAAIVLASLAFLRARRDIGGQLLLAMTASALLLFFVPLLAVRLSDIVSEQGVWRLPWLVPVPIILAYACHTALEKLPPGKRALAAAAPLAAVVAVAGAAFVVQEHYAFADGRVYYVHTSSSALLPWTNESITGGGVRYAFGHGWRPSESSLALMRELDATAPRGSTIMVPRRLEFFVPELVGDVHSVGDDFDLFFLTGMYERTEQLDAIEQLEAHGVDYVAVELRTSADELFRRFARLDAFGVGAGSPAAELGEQENDAGVPFWAWAFAPDAPEQVISSVELPADAVVRTGNVQFEMLFAPSVTGIGETVARFELRATSLDERDPSPITALFNVQVPDGQEAGRLVGAFFPSRGLFDPGARYQITLTRLGDAPEDTYPADLWFVQAKMKYWPRAAHVVAGTPFWFLDVRAATNR
jgi:hypothetical protein